MINLANNLWVGNSDEATAGNAKAAGIRCVLNVAHDLQSYAGWSQGIEYAQVGLVDGPGNELADYCAAVLCLRMLLRRHKSVLVFDHGSARALVVGAMCLNLTEGQWRPSPTAWSHWPTWEERISIIRNGIDIPLPKVHPAHIKAFDRMPWGLLQVL